MEKIERLREIAKKTAAGLSADDKDFISALSRETGIEFIPRKRCSNCYIDQAIVLYNKLKPVEQKNDGRRWHINGGRAFRVDGKRYCEETITDADVEMLIVRGLPKHWFNESK